MGESGDQLRSLLQAQNALLAEQCRLLREVGEWVRSGKALGAQIALHNGHERGIAALVSASTARPSLGIAAEVSTPLTEVLPAWITWLQGRGKRAGTQLRYRENAEAVIAWTGWATIHDLNLKRAVEYLAMRRAGNPEQDIKPVAGATNDQTVSSLRSLGDYLEKTEQLTKSPFRNLERSNEQGAPGSRAPSTAEARALIAASIERCRGNRKAKGNAPLFWCFLFKTGLRVEEASSIRWRDIDLGGPVPRITTDPAWSKNRRRQTVPLDPEILGLLIEHTKCVSAQATDLVFPITPNRHTWHEDREAAGIAVRDGQNEPLTQHGCRKWLDTQLDETGATAGERYKIIRHSGNLDEDRYNRPTLERLQTAVSRLPKLWPDGHKYSGKIPHGLMDSPGDGRYLNPSAIGFDSAMPQQSPNTSARIDRPTAGPRLTLKAGMAGRSIRTDVDAGGLNTAIESGDAHSRALNECPSAEAVSGLSPAERARLLKLIVALATLATLIGLALWSYPHWRVIRQADGRVEAAALDWRGV